MAAVAHAQFPEADPQREAARQRVEQQLRERIAQVAEQQQQAGKACVAPNGPSRPINSVATFDGQRYRCMEVFLPSTNDVTLRVRIAGWVKY